MAFSSSSSSLSKVMYLLFLILLLMVSSCCAIRPGSRMSAEEKVLIMDSQDMKLDDHKGNYETAFKYKAMMFNFLPKGSPVPPSGPSKRHNSVVNSTPQN